MNDTSQPKMDPALKAKWVEALRSGKYEQGKSYLRIEDTFCCLGVLCDIAGAEWRGSDEGNSHAVGGGYFAHLKTGEIGEEKLPRRFAMTVGLTLEEQRALWEMNDDENRSFAEIAAYIESHL